MKYTKGKWETRGLNIFVNSFTKIAHVHMLNGEYGKYEASANANLISKAPQMYEALKDIVLFHRNKGKLRPDLEAKIYSAESLLKELES